MVAKKGWVGGKANRLGSVNIYVVAARANELEGGTTGTVSLGSRLYWPP
jgi:hypothetical protein